jgi:hypothetical protein
MKATAKASADIALTATEPTSIKDAAYRFARAGETATDLARFIMVQAPEFPAEVSAELKADLFAGFMTRAHELWGQDYFTRGESGVLIKAGNSLDGQAEYPKGSTTLSLHYCYSFSQQEFGQLKNKDQQLHGLVKKMRDKFSKYASNNLKALKRSAHDLLSDGKSRERGATKAFTESLTDTFADYDKRVKNAENRGDDTANPAKFRTARDAFWKVYNAK